MLGRCDVVAVVTMHRDGLVGCDDESTTSRSNASELVACRVSSNEVGRLFVWHLGTKTPNSIRTFGY